MIGKTLGHYEIIGLLGKGGMGEVYRARDEKLGRDVALKVLPSELAADAGRRTRFEREARAVAALKHPNIVTLHSIEEADGIHFITMEYIEGNTLSDEIVKDGAPLDRFFDLAIPLADALASAHAKSIAHRDVKPANIMLDADGRLKILDFGLAKIFDSDVEADETIVARSDSVTGEGGIVGTAAYMSPEQAEGRAIDARSDVFSLGVVLYEMAAGKRPFHGASNIATISAILKDRPPSLTEVRPILPRHLGRIISRCVAKDPERRYQSALDVRNELEELRGEVTSGASDGSSDEPVRTDSGAVHSGWRRVVFPAPGVMVVVAGLLAYGGWRQTEAPPPVATAIRSLAVLPFANLSHDASNDYFSDGMTDVLTTELAQLQALKVIARNSAARFKDSQRPPADIARELGVGGLVSGSVARDGDQVRISAQLADAATDRVLWAESYVRPVRDVLLLQGEVSRAIAGAIALELSPDDETRLGELRTVDPRALDEYLKGRFLWTQRTENAVRQSLSHFRAAIELDPNFALGHTGIADAYIILGAYNWMEPRKAAPIALEAIKTAVALDPTAGEPHASRGDVAFHAEWDFELAARELDLAIEMSPGYATAYHWRAEVSAVLGHTDEAIGFLERGAELDPLYPWAAHFLGYLYQLKGRLADAENSYRRALEISPAFGYAKTALVRLRLAEGQTTEALVMAQRDADADPSALSVATLGVAHALAGQPNEARATLRRLQEMGEDRYVSPFERARVEAALGNHTEAINSLRAAMQDRTFSLPYMTMHVDIEFQGLVGHPECDTLLASIGNPAAP